MPVGIPVPGWIRECNPARSAVCPLRTPPSSLPSRHGRRAAQIRGEAGASHRAGQVGTSDQGCAGAVAHRGEGASRVLAMTHATRSLSNSQRVVILSMRKAHKEDAWIKLMCDPNDDSQSQAGPKTGATWCKRLPSFRVPTTRFPHRSRIPRADAPIRPRKPRNAVPSARRFYRTASRGVVEWSTTSPAFAASCACGGYDLSIDDLQGPQAPTGARAVAHRSCGRPPPPRVAVAAGAGLPRRRAEDRWRIPELSP